GLFGFGMNKSPNSLLAQTRRLLRQSDLRARKGLGQHFLIDQGVLETIISAAELSPDDIVLEVGPGLGILTRELATKAGGVIAIELDDKLAALLKKTLASFNNVTIVNDNVLKLEPKPGRVPISRMVLTAPILPPPTFLISAPFTSRAIM
ncbi:unnamed protein product, partial [marine sediment metagenome]